VVCTGRDPDEINSLGDIMSLRTYPRTQCHICGEFVTTAGAGSIAHKKRHVRESKMVAMYSRVLDKTEYMRPETAKSYESGELANYANFFRINV